MSRPAINRCVAAEWRSICGVILRLSLACSTALRMSKRMTCVPTEPPRVVMSNYCVEGKNSDRALV